MSASLPNVYVSYAWGGESEKTVDEIQQALQARGITLVRDKAELGYKGRIREFMQEIGRGHAVVVVLSDKYLRSPNCMFELLEIMANGEMHERIFPVVLRDADIYDAARCLQYKKHWKDKLDELNAAVEQTKVGMANLHHVPEQASRYDRFGDHILKLTDLFANMNTLSPEEHASAGYRHLIGALEGWLQKAARDAAAPTPATSPAAQAALVTPVTSASPETGPRVFGFNKAAERLLDPQDAEVTALRVVVQDEQGDDDTETELLWLAVEDGAVWLQLGEDFEALELSPAAMARVAAATARNLGRIDKLTVAHLRAAVTGVLEQVYGLAGERYSFKAVADTGEDTGGEDGLAGVPDLEAHIDELLDADLDARSRKSGARGRAAKASQDDYWADVTVVAVDPETDAEHPVVTLTRWADGTLYLFVGDDEEPPEDLAITEDKREALLELGFTDNPDRAPDCLEIDVAEFDRDALKDLIAAAVELIVADDQGHRAGYELQSWPNDRDA